jgi:hypothetical protein
MKSERVMSDASSALTHAVVGGHLEIVRLLLSDDRIDPSANNNDALYRSCFDDRIDIVKALLEDDRVNPFYANGNAIRIAIDKKHMDIVELIMRNRKPSDSYWNDMTNSNRNISDLEMIRMLLNSNTFWWDMHRYTPIVTFGRHANETET